MHEVLEKLTSFREEATHDSKIMLEYYEVVLILEFINKVRENEMFNYDLLDKIISCLGK